MSTKYYRDGDNDIWCFTDEGTYLYVNSNKMFNNYHKWVPRNYSFDEIKRIYKLVPISDEQLFIEML